MKEKEKTVYFFRDDYVDIPRCVFLKAISLSNKGEEKLSCFNEYINKKERRYDCLFLV